MSDEIIIHRECHHVALELNRPDKRNALSYNLIEALIAAVDEAESSGLKALAFYGAGKNFSAGFDFTNWHDQSEGDLCLRFIRIETLLQKIAHTSLTTVALAHGRNFGAGVDLFAVCDWRIAAAETSFCMPGLKFGLVLGTRRFAARVGVDVARSILAETRTFNTAEAISIGFVTRCVKASAWPQIVDEAAAMSVYSPGLLEAALQMDQPDTELAELVRSATAPGLKDRIAAYLKK